jgi:uncharacterized protein YecE (DUF72 family)
MCNRSAIILHERRQRMSELDPAYDAEIARRIFRPSRPAPWIATASHVYRRGHGLRGRHRGHYRSNTLDRWKRWLIEMRRTTRSMSISTMAGKIAPEDAARLVNGLSARLPPL